MIFPDLRFQAKKVIVIKMNRRKTNGTWDKKCIKLKTESRSELRKRKKEETKEVYQEIIKNYK